MILYFSIVNSSRLSILGVLKNTLRSLNHLEKLPFYILEIFLFHYDGWNIVLYGFKSLKLSIQNLSIILSVSHWSYKRFPIRNSTTDTAKYKTYRTSNNSNRLSSWSSATSTTITSIWWAPGTSWTSSSSTSTTPTSLTLGNHKKSKNKKKKKDFSFGSRHKFYLVNLNLSFKHIKLTYSPFNKLIQLYMARYNQIV